MDAKLLTKFRGVLSIEAKASYWQCVLAKA
jgi:hypothetical protein